MRRTGVEPDSHHKAAAELDEQYAQLTESTKGHTGSRAWLWLLWSQGRRPWGIAVLGALGVASTTLVPYIFGQLNVHLKSQDSAQAARLAFIMGSLVVFSAVVSWLKERHEMHLVFGVRFLLHRSLAELSLEPRVQRDQSPPTVGSFSTMPPQISQFAYVIDLVLTIGQALALGVLVLAQYGVVGGVALIGTLVATAIAVILVHRIGAVFATLMKLESARVDRLRDVSRNAVRLARAGLSHASVEWIHEGRLRQIPVLKRRARLQVANGMLAATTVPVVVTLTALLGSATGAPQSMDLLPLLLASTLLYATLQECVTNYRVIRLAIPMLHEWDRWRSATTDPTAEEGAEAIAGLLAAGPGLSVLTCDERTRGQLLHVALAQSATEVMVVPANPNLPVGVARVWHRGLTRDDQLRWRSLLDQLKLPRDVQLGADASRVSSLSNGERHRLAIALAIFSDAPMILMDDSLRSLDAVAHDIVVAVLRQVGRPVVLVSQTPFRGECDNRLSASSSESGQRLVVRCLDGPQQEIEQSALNTQPVDGSQAGVDVPPLVSDALGAESADTLTWANPDVTLSSARQVVALLIGWWAASWLVAVCVLSGVMFAAFAALLAPSSSSDGAVNVAAVSAVCFGMLVAHFALYAVQLLAPIQRLSDLHLRISERVTRLSLGKHTGALLGRFGDDFNAAQMEVPGALVTATMVVIQFLILTGAIFVSNSLLAIAALSLLPLSAWVYRVGERRLISSMSSQAEARNNFIDLASHLMGNPMLLSSRMLRSAGRAGYADEEAAYFHSCRRVVESMMKRRTELQALGLGLLMVGLAASVLLPANGVIAAPLLVYFVFTLSSQLPTVIEAVQGVSLSLATALRVVSLETVGVTASSAIGRRGQPEVLAELRSSVGRGRVVRLGGPTGSGKSVVLREFRQELGDAERHILLEPEPVATTITLKQIAAAYGLKPSPEHKIELLPLGELPRGVAQRAMLDLALGARPQTLVLDEALNSLDDDSELAAITDAGDFARNSNFALVFVSHTLPNISVDQVVSVSEHSPA